MKQIFFVLAMLGLVGCSQKVPMPKTEQAQPLFMHQPRNDRNESVQATQQMKMTSETASSKDSGIQRVPDFTKDETKHFKDAIKRAKNGTVHSDDGAIRLAVENMPVPDFIQYAFTQVLQRNYTISERAKKIKGTVMIDVPEPMSKSQFLETVRSLLKLHGIEIREESNVLFVDRSNRRGRAAAKKSEIVEHVGYGRSLRANWDDQVRVAWIVPFYYTHPSSVTKIFHAVGLKGINTVNLSKSELMIVAKTEEIRKALEFVDLIDISKMRRKIPYLISLDHIPAETFSQQITDIFALQGIETTTDIGSTGIGIYTLNDLNAVYVLANKPSWIDTIRFWKQKLDRVKGRGDTKQLFTYKARNRKAEDLADAANQLLGTVRNDANATQPSESVAASENVVIIADEHTNTLNMNISAKKYNQLLPMLKSLDVLPLQVIVEVTLAEVTLTDDFQFGFEWYLRENDFSFSTRDGLGLGGSGLVGSLVKNAGKLDLAMNAYSETKLLDIISKPRIVVLNNQSGSINVGTQVPIVTSENSSSDLTNANQPSILRNVSYRNTGVDVSVKPTVNSDGVLTLELDLSLSEAQTNNTSQIDSPIIVERSLTTSVVMESGDTIFVGGLISNNTSNTVQGVPWLEQIPLLGYLFKTDSDKTTKTELVMLVRPTIVSSGDIIALETEKFKALLQSISFSHEQTQNY